MTTLRKLPLRGASSKDADGSGAVTKKTGGVAAGLGQKASANQPRRWR
jgi:hypothetical protein